MDCDHQDYDLYYDYEEEEEGDEYGQEHKGWEGGRILSLLVMVGAALFAAHRYSR